MARLETERKHVAGRFAELETKEKASSDREDDIARVRMDLERREAGFKDRIEDMDKRRADLADEMDKLAQEKQKVEKMKETLDKRRQVIGEQADNISEITKKLEDLRARSKKRMEEAAKEQTLQQSAPGTPPAQ